jgi:hypothetical protein
MILIEKGNITLNEEICLNENFFYTYFVSETPNIYEFIRKEFISKKDSKKPKEKTKKSSFN